MSLYRAPARNINTYAYFKDASILTLPVKMLAVFDK